MPVTKRDRQGRELTLREWSDLMQDRAYRVVAEDTVHDVLVRTMWEGLDEPAGFPGSMYCIGVCRTGGGFDTVVEPRTQQDAVRLHGRIVELIGHDPGPDLVRRLRDTLAAEAGQP